MLRSSLPMAFAALLIATPALADAASAFRAGQWAVVVRDGRAEATPASLILAGRAQLSIAGYETRDKAVALAIVTRAEQDFDAALAKAPGSLDAQLQKAVAIGYRAQLTRGIGLAKDARKRFEAVRKADPKNALAWGALGGWHGGSIASVGSFMAGAVLGAKKAEMERCYAEALRLAPGVPSTRLFFAVTLLDLDAGNAKRAASLLKGIDALPAVDGFEALMRAQGVQLAAALARGDNAAAQVTARRLKAFSAIS